MVLAYTNPGLGLTGNLIWACLTNVLLMTLYSANNTPYSALSGVMTVALSLVPYSAAYIADAGADAMRQLRAGSSLGALLFLPNLTRAFFVLVMSSSAAAAIGVTEGITVILRHAEQLPALGDRLVLFATGIVLFGIPLQAGFAIMSVIQRRLSLKVARPPADAA